MLGSSSAASAAIHMDAYHEFVQLVYEACHASEAVDYFNLHSENPASVAAFGWLGVEQQKAFLALAKHLQQHADAIIGHIGEPPELADEPPAKLLRTKELTQARHIFLSWCATEAAITGDHHD